MKQVLIIGIVSLLIANHIEAEEQYLCTADKVSGFSFNENSKEWKQSSFKANSKYVVSRLSDSSTAFVVREIGNSFPDAWCEDPFTDAGYLHCRRLGGDFSLNRKNGRYIASSLMGYLNVVPGVNDITDKTSDTPYIEIGKCSPF